MTIDQIRQMLERLERSSVEDFEVELHGALWRGRFARRSAAPVADLEATPVAAMPGAANAANAGNTAAAPAEAWVVKASSMGVFSAAHPLTGTTCAVPGGSVSAGEPLGYLTLGTLVLPVAAPRAAVLRRCLVAPGQVVGYGQPLFELAL